MTTRQQVTVYNDPLRWVMDGAFSATLLCEAVDGLGRGDKQAFGRLPDMLQGEAWCRQVSLISGVEDLRAGEVSVSFRPVQLRAAKRPNALRLVLFINAIWLDEWGGALELGGQAIFPRLGRAVLWPVDQGAKTQPVSEDAPALVTASLCYVGKQMT